MVLYVTVGIIIMSMFMERGVDIGMRRINNVAVKDIHRRGKIKSMAKQKI
jgi:hypothetical protein